MAKLSEKITEARLIWLGHQRERQMLGRCSNDKKRILFLISSYD